VGESNEGHQLRVIATSTDSDGSGTSATSAATAAVVDIAPTLSASISGRPQEDRTLTASAVANDSDAVVTYQWQSLSGSTWSNISGATAATYTVAEVDEGHQLRVAATSADSDGSGTSATSAATAAVVDAAKDDFNGDAMSDVVLQNIFTNGNVMIDLMNGTSITSSYTVTNPQGLNYRVAAMADFNHDGNADIVLQNPGFAPQIWLMNGSTIASSVSLAAPPSSWHIVAAADFNGDGNPDLLWQNSNGQPAIWEMNGTSVIGSAGLATPPSLWRVIGAGDFNGDGYDDILWQNSDGTPAIWEMNGTTVINAVGLSNPSSAWHIVGTGDFNGDGYSDILLVNTSTNTPMIWEMNGASIISSVQLTAPPSSWKLIGTSDVNGDGKSDILWQNADGTVSVWEMNGTSIVSAMALPDQGSNWVVQDDGPIPADQMDATAAGIVPAQPRGYGSDTPLGNQPTDGVLWRGIDPAGAAAGPTSAQANASLYLSMPDAVGLAGAADGPNPLAGRTAAAYQQPIFASH
jgi:hypothetical protein